MASISTATPSAFGAYIRTLRHGCNMSQERVCQQLHTFGLKSAIKDLYAWETGRRRPSSPAKAALIKVLHGSSAQADDLLLYDMQIDQTRSVDHANNVPVHPTELCTECLTYGRDQADTWLATQIDPMPPSSNDLHASSHIEQAHMLVTALQIQKPHLLADLLRYGTFLLYDHDHAL